MKLNLQITKVTIACFILLSAVNFTAKAQEVITLQKAIDLTLERNLTIKQAQFTEAISEETLKQSKYNQLPNLTAGPQALLTLAVTLTPLPTSLPISVFLR
jgi:outer membrane protein